MVSLKLLSAFLASSVLLLSAGYCFDFPSLTHPDDIITYNNTATEGVFGVFLLFILFFIAFLTVRSFPYVTLDKALLGSLTFTWVIGVLMWWHNWIPDYIILGITGLMLLMVLTR